MNLVICHVESLSPDDFPAELHVTTDGATTAAEEDVNVSGRTLSSLSVDDDQTGCSDHEGKYQCLPSLSVEHDQTGCSDHEGKCECLPSLSVQHDQTGCSDH